MILITFSDSTSHGFKEATATYDAQDGFIEIRKDKTILARVTKESIKWIEYSPPVPVKVVAA